MKDRVMERKPTSLPDLIDIVRHVRIEEITVDYFQKLFYLMPRHTPSCLENKGLHTKY